MAASEPRHASGDFGGGGAAEVPVGLRPTMNEAPSAPNPMTSKRAAGTRRTSFRDLTDGDGKTQVIAFFEASYLHWVAPGRSCNWLVPRIEPMAPSPLSLKTTSRLSSSRLLKMAPWARLLRLLTLPPGRRYSSAMDRRGDSAPRGGIRGVAEKGNSYP
jgi:hypothetical protein